MNKELSKKPIKKGSITEEKVREAAILKAFEQYQEEHSVSGEEGEEGEFEMFEGEEGEFEMEEGESEMEYPGEEVVVSGESDGAEPPKLIPIVAGEAQSMKQTKQPAK